MRDDKRILTIDALRGFALFGILQVNILVFSSVYYGTGLAPPAGRPVLDDIAVFLISAIFELKFYLLFSFLFGYSMTLQLRSAEKADVAFLPRMLRRQAALFGIGVIHALTLFHGDILTTYAVLGVLLLCTVGWSDTIKIYLAVLLVAATAAFWLLISFLPLHDPLDGGGFQMLTDAQVALTAYSGGPFSIVAQHIADLQSFLPILLLVQAPCAFAMFLTGFVAGQRKLLERSDLYRAHLGRVGCWGLAVGLPGGLASALATRMAAGTAWETAGLAVSIVTSPFLTAGLIVVMLTLFESGRVTALRDVLASAGRMALSNYLAQSIACALIFHGYGLGLIDRLSMAFVLILAMAIFAAQLVASHWWLRHFRYGPIEWLLRAVTIGRWPQWKVAEALSD